VTRNHWLRFLFNRLLFPTFLVEFLFCWLVLPVSCVVPEERNLESEALLFRDKDKPTRIQAVQ